MTIDRRTLIRRSCITAAGLTVRPAWSVAGMFRHPREGRTASASNTVLVVVQLNGGNDGLNTVVPFGDPAYAAARPRIGLTASQVLPISGEPGVGLHPSLANLHGYLEAGKLAIVQSVGYPGPDMSHFRSDDIWEKAALAPETEATGWLARALAQLYPQDADAIHSLSSGDVTAFRGTAVTTPTLDQGVVIGDPNQIAALRAMATPAGRLNRDYAGHIAELALADSDIIQAALSGYNSTIVYPEDSPPFAQLTALISANIGARVLWVGQGGYDTHDGQLGMQEDLLTLLDQSLDAFYRDLVAHGQDQNVIVMTYSEFGRRVEDNDSGGTDHGTAAPMFILGSRVRSGFYGEPPSLTDLDPDGNLKFAVDFRQVYATVLAKWIDTDPLPVLGNVDWPTLAFL